MFSSERIYLRKVTPEDTDTYHKWRNDPEVMENTSPQLDVYTRQETADFIESISQASSSKSYIIMEQEHDKPIGITSIINLDYKNRNAELIVDIGDKDYWGNGYGQEAVNLIIDYSFNELNLHKLHLRVFSFNTRAIRLYEKLGFEHEGEFKDHLFRNGKWHNIVAMALFQEQFLS